MSSMTDETGFARSIGLRLGCARVRFSLRACRFAILGTLAAGLLSGCRGEIQPIASYPAFAPVMCVAISEDNRLLAAASIATFEDPVTRETVGGTVVVHHLNREKTEIRLYRNRVVHSIAFDPTGSSIWAGYSLPASTAHQKSGNLVTFLPPIGEIVQWDLASRKELRSVQLQDAVIAIALSPDGKWLAALTADHKKGRKAVQVKTWSVDKLEIRTHLALEGCTYVQEWLGPCRPLTFSPDGRLLAVASSLEPGQPARLTLWDVERNEKSRSIQFDHGPIRWLSFSSDSRRIAITCYDGVAICACDDTQMSGKPEFLPDVRATAAAWVRNRDVLVCFHRVYNVRCAALYDLSTKTHGTVLCASERGVMSVTVSSDGSLVAIGTGLGRVNVWRP